MAKLIRPIRLRTSEEKIERHATWLELFFDLIFVVIITELAARLFHHLNYFGVLECSALFIPVMWVWTSYTVFAARFDNDDAIHWLMTLITMFAGVIMAIQIPVALESGATGFSIGFLIAQFCLLLLYLRVFYNNLSLKTITLWYLIGFGSAYICWIISLFFEPPYKFIFWTLGMSIYLLMPWLGKKRILSKAPLDIVYIPERFGLFTIIILGQTIASVVIGLKSAHWNFASLITGTMGFILAIIIWGQYYRFTHIADYKCTLSSGQPYIYAHIPLIVGLIIMGVCVEYFIKLPLSMDENIRMIFCLGILLYLSSFYLLQYIAIPHFGLRGISYIIGTIVILILFFFLKPPPMIAIPALVGLFIILFAIQYWLGYQILHKTKRDHKSYQ